MQINRKNTSETKVEIKVVVDQSTIDKAKSETVRKLSKNLTVSGFRSGKAPAHLAEKNLDQALLQKEFLDNVINQVYQQIVSDENLRPVSQPSVSVTKFVPFTDLELLVEVDVIGKIELTDYKAIRLNKPTVEVKAADVSEVLDQLRARQAARSRSLGQVNLVTR